MSLTGLWSARRADSRRTVTVDPARNVMPQLCALVQHHPSRAHLLPRLLERLQPLPVEVVSDPQPDSLNPSPWRTYRACLEAFPDDASHVLIIQDDGMPCRDLAAALPTVIEAAQRFTHDDPIIALAMYDESDVADRAWIEEVTPPDAGSTGFVHLIPANRMVPVVAAIWPRAAAETLLAVTPEVYMGPGTIPDAPPGPKNHPFPTYEHWGTIRYWDRERWNDPEFQHSRFDDPKFSFDNVEGPYYLGQVDKHEHWVINRHRDVLPPVVEILPSLVSHQDLGSVAQPGAEHQRVRFSD